MFRSMRMFIVVAKHWEGVLRRSDGQFSVAVPAEFEGMMAGIKTKRGMRWLVRVC